MRVENNRDPGGAVHSVLVGQKPYRTGCHDPGIQYDGMAV